MSPPHDTKMEETDQRRTFGFMFFNFYPVGNTREIFSVHLLPY